ncbi:alpha/beta hydrolase [Henriciella litoralis]|uniref:alpha/beta hydrolase n=1 Tax=Henriciella litoralis TaxID=568102 RepID=UPI001F2FEE17|nr:alpha/beta hydrolase [Henriciella litoralis]
MKRITHLMAPIALFIAACSASQTPSSEAPQMAETDIAPIMTWSDLLSRERPEPTQTITVGELETDVVDLWLPDGAGPHPSVIMIHGGCWQKSIADRTLMNYAAEAMREAGLAVWNIEYRGVDEDGGGYPGTFLDVARAVDAFGERGEGYGFDTARVAAFGHSAGGHLALWAAARSKIADTSPLYSDAPFYIPAVLSSGGLPDLEASAPVTQAGCLADIMDVLTGEASPERQNVFSDTSPTELLPISAVQFTVNGMRDRIAPSELGKAYTEKAKAAGDPAIFVAIPGEGHVELIAPGSEAFAEQLRLLKEMLGEEGSD